MDGPSWTPFSQPPYDDDPINTMQTFDNHFDQAFDQTYDWAQAQWAPWEQVVPGSYFLNSSTSNGSSFLCTGWAQPLTANDNHLLQIGSSDFPLYPQSLPDSLNKASGKLFINGNVPLGHQETQAFCVPSEPLAPLRVAETNVAEKSPNVLSEEYLSTLTPKQLEEFKKKATELLKKSHKKAQEATVTPTLQHQRPTKRAKPSGRAQKDSITCEHPGCTTTFSRKKDQNRHFRLKHGNPQSFRCPIINCWMGEGHEFQRSDKLRDHLNTKSLASATWQCIIPDCSETCVGKEGIIHHLKTHEQAERQLKMATFQEYGLRKEYLDQKNICTIYGCPFGTNSDDVMKSHLLTPHEGPLCPCPITSCEQYFRDKSEVSGHLSRGHDALTREYFKSYLKDQGFWWETAVFICPICKFEISKEDRPNVYEDNKFRQHFKTHGREERAENFEALVQAFVFSFGPGLRLRTWFTDDRDQNIFKYMTGESLKDHLEYLKKNSTNTIGQGL